MAGQRVPTTEELSVPRSFKGMGNRPSSLEELLRLQAIEKSKRLATQRESYPPLGIKLEGYKPKFKPFVSSLDNINVEKIFNPDMPIEGDAVGPPTDSLKTVEQIVADGARPESVDQRFAPNPLPSGQTQQPSQIQEETFLDESVRQPTVLSDPKILAGETLRNHEWNNKLYKVPPTKESGFLDTILGGVRSFTSPIARGAKELFNDPKRMALITGGLRMADPNSYYDAQGFYSPWGGINAGLGTGIKTYKSLSEPRKLGFKKQEEIKHKNAMALLQEKNRLGIGTSVGEYRRVLQQMRALERQNPKHPDIPYLKAKLEAMTRLDPSSRGKDYRLMNEIRTTYGDDSQEMKDFLTVGPKPSVINLGDTRKLISSSGNEVYSGDVNLGPSETPEHKETVAASKEIGAVKGGAIVSLPSALKAKNRMITNIDAVINHPNLHKALGMVDQHINLDWYNADIQARIKQIVGKNFMTAYKGLKGGGQITEIEGNKAQQALARMDQAQSPKDFKQALMDLKEVVLEAHQNTVEESKLSISPQRRSGDKRKRKDDIPEGFEAVN